MEDQLAAYRARKAKEQAEQNVGKASWFSTRPTSRQGKQDGDKKEENKEEFVDNSSRRAMSCNQPLKQNPGYFRIPAVIANSPLGNYISQDSSLLTNTFFLKIILWLALLGFFILVEFAAVFIVCTLFYVMYVNMRSDADAKKPGELSAYSVFNPNCERIDGTLTAEQFEKELRYGPGST